MNNYYEILQVDKNATLEVINRIYKYHIKKNHPDLFEGEEKENAKQKVQLLNEAYETLSNKEKRKLYDESILEKQKEDEHEVVNEILLRLEEENEILRKQLLYKDNILKQVFNELNIPYDLQIFEPNFKEYNSEDVTKTTKKIEYENKISNNYIEKIKITFFKMITLIILSVFLIITVSKITGNNYIDFLKSLFF